MSKESNAAANQSIHPRVKNGRTVHEKKNTAHPTRRTTKAQKRLHVRQHAYKDDASTTKPGSFKKS
jgi:hypothetical protein